MRHLQVTFAALLLGSVGVCGASAASHGTKVAMNMSRYAAIESCSRQAQSRYPSTGDSDSDRRNRAFAYVGCMRTLGFNP